MFEKKIFKRDFKEYSGCLHNHSRHSYDSNYPVAKLIEAAEKNNLDFVTINDHMSLQAKADPELQSTKSTKVIVGTEVNDYDQQHHYLVFNTEKVIDGKSPEHFVREYSRENAIGFVAHPFEHRRSCKYEKYEWKTNEILPINGVEIWNFASEWIGKMFVPLNGILMVLFPSLFIHKPNKRAFRLFEKYQDNGKKISIIGSTDAHYIVKKYGPLKVSVLAHRTLFKTLRTNVLLLGNQEANEENILTALKNGNSYVVNYSRGYPYNFYAGICDAEGIGATFGEELSFKENLNLYYHLPLSAKVKLVKDGKIIAKNIDSKGVFPITEKGRYRLEISRFGFGWIYTNYIYIT